MDLVDLIGFAGAAVMLTAYALSNVRVVRMSTKAMAGMNLGAGVALALNGLVHQAWPSTVVNTVWFVIAGVSLVSAGRAGDGSGSNAGTTPVELEHDRRSRDDSRIVGGSQDRAAGRPLLIQHPDDPVDRRLVLL